jgi:hypothetical protein
MQRVQYYSQAGSVNYYGERNQAEGKKNLRDHSILTR